MDHSRGVEKVRCSGEGKRNEEFGSVLSSTTSVDFDSRQAIGPEACELQSFPGIPVLLNGDEFRSGLQTRENENRVVVCADEKLAGFLELESMTREATRKHG